MPVKKKRTTTTTTTTTKKTAKKKVTKKVVKKVVKGAAKKATKKVARRPRRTEPAPRAVVASLVVAGDAQIAIPPDQQAILDKVKAIGGLSLPTTVVDGNVMATGAKPSPTSPLQGHRLATAIDNAGESIEGNLLVKGRALDHDRSQDLSVPGLGEGGKEVSGVQGETVVEQEMRHNSVAAAANTINERWEKRIEQDGTKAFVCPRCKPVDQEPFVFERGNQASIVDAYNKCQQHILMAHGAQVQQMKIEGVADSNYTPRPITISPDRTIADIVGPQMAEFMANMKANGSSIEEMKQMQSEAAGRQDGIPVSQLKLMMDHDALAAIPKLSDRVLREFANWSFFSGRKQVCRWASQEIERRNTGRVESAKILVDF
jgi:hypothetical protein